MYPEGPVRGALTFLMRKPVAAFLVIILMVALVVLTVRLQPRATATLFRNGDHIVVRTSPLFLRSVGTPCRARLIDGRPLFEETMQARTATLDEITLRLRFTYAVPEHLPAGWPEGDWCRSLQARVSVAVDRAMATIAHEKLLIDRRAAGDRVGVAIKAALDRDGLRPTALSARADVPPGFKRARTAADLARRVRKTRPVIFIGLDGADWQLLDQYIAGGTMPNLARIVTSGSRGILETEHPPLSPLVWTTMMTGRGPLEHGILDFTRFNPQSHDKEPITSDERAVPAIWNMLTAGGKSVAVFGLWATYAAEPVHGVNVSDRLFNFLYSDQQRPQGVTYPATREPWAARGVAAAEQRVDGARMRGYLPSISDGEVATLARSTNPYGDPPAALRRILVETEIYRSLALDLLATGMPDLTIVYLQGTDSIGHVFAPFAPPRQPAISESDFNRYSAVPQRYFSEIDALIGQFLAIAEREHAVLMIASDHGFYWREGRPTQISSTATATAAKWHRAEGIFALWGEDTRQAPGQLLRGGVRQVCATLLALTGMPAADGGTTPLPGAPPPAPPVAYARFYQRAAPPPVTTHPGSHEEELAKLRALGYIGSGESSRSAVATSDSRTANAYNNAGLILRDQHRTEEAITAFDRAIQVDPKSASAMWNLSETLMLAGRDLDRSDALLVEALRNGINDGPRLVASRATGYRNGTRASRTAHLLDAAVTAAPGSAELRMFRGTSRMERHDCEAALGDFQAVAQQQPQDALALASVGLAQLCLGNGGAAQESFRRSLAIDPNQPMIRSLMQ